MDLISLAARAGEVDTVRMCGCGAVMLITPEASQTTGGAAVDMESEQSKLLGAWVLPMQSDQVDLRPGSKEH